MGRVGRTRKYFFFPIFFHFPFYSLEILTWEISFRNFC
jgi:hypothetical protein